MLNQIIIVGRLTKDIEEYDDKDKKRTKICLAVPRSWKNADGEYETDFIDCIIQGEVAKNTKEYVRKGDIIGIKGRIETRINENGVKFTDIIGEKVTFLSSKQNDE